jgi:hypothetical protein
LPAEHPSVNGMAEGYSKTPSGLASGAAKGASFQQVGVPENTNSGTSPVIWALVLISLLLSSAAFYSTMFMPHQLSPDQKNELKAIADNLRAIQQKDITMTSPLNTTAYIDEAFPAGDIFPNSFAIPLVGKVVINQEVPAQTTSGQIVNLKVNATIPVFTQVQIDPDTSLNATRIIIKKEIPIKTNFFATYKVQALYGKELNTIIDQVENLSK